jgi:hypothetical protein
MARKHIYLENALRVARYYVTAYENEKEEFEVMVQEEKVQLQREKEKFLS